ncbi:MAG: DUF2807 domain-containing protein [Chitinophagaceae bacterium]|nr:DUF2807 domain-containing protein [Chitinophagaceae bacterium]
MKKTGLLFIFSLLLASGFAQKTTTINDENAQKRNVSGFTSIEVSDGVDVYITQSDEESVVVSANKTEYRDKIQTKVEKGVLKIYFGDDKGFTIGWRDRKLRAYISIKSLENLHAGGGSDIIIKGTITSDKLSLDLSGGSDFVGDVKSAQLTVGISGGSDVKVSGAATNLKVNASGGSDFSGNDMKSEYAIVEVSGGSDATLSVSKELYAEASGGSDIHYSGNPVIKHKSSSGGGSVTKRGK